MWEKKNTQKLLLGKKDVNKSLGRCRCKWKNIKMNLKRNKKWP
jgi:hypothetical protein